MGTPTIPGSAWLERPRRYMPRVLPRGRGKGWPLRGSPRLAVYRHALSPPSGGYRWLCACLYRIVSGARAARRAARITRGRGGAEVGEGTGAGGRGGRNCGKRSNVPARAVLRARPSVPCLKTCTLHVQSAASISAVCSARAKWCRLRRPTTSAQKETEAALARYRRARSARPKWSAPLWTCKVHPPPQGVHRFARAKWCCANRVIARW